MNPTEEQTSPRTFEEFWASIYAPRILSEKSMGRRMALYFWDARQPEIDRLRAALERITESSPLDLPPFNQGPASCWFCGAEFRNARHSMDISSPDDWRGTHESDCDWLTAREALDG